MSEVESEIDHAMYVWAVEMASVWDERGDLDGYCYWWAWRIDERWDEAERTAYEAWKYDQMRGYAARAAKLPPAAHFARWRPTSKKRRKGSVRRNRPAPENSSWGFRELRTYESARTGKTGG